MTLTESDELAVLKTVVQRMSQANIPYMLTGSVANNFYSVPRMTRDIDIVVELDIAGIGKFYNLFKDDFYIDKKMIKEAITNQSLFNIIHNKAIVKIDFIIRKDLEYRKAEFARRQLVAILDYSIYIVSAEDLVLSKLIWAKDTFSEMQIKDIQNIFDNVADIDIKYIEGWVDKLGIKKIYSKVRK